MADECYMTTMQSSTSNCNSTANGAPINDNFSDSGYGSHSPSPSGAKMSSDTQLEPLALDAGHWPTKKRLRVFEREIPESAISQLRDWKVLFSGQLRESVSKAAPATSGFNIAMKLKHLGTNETDSRLYLVFFCDKKLAKHVRKFSMQKHVLEEMRGQFLPQVIAQGPRLLHGEEVYTPITHDPARGSCGMVLYYFADNDEKDDSDSEFNDPILRVGTLGGIVKVSFPEEVRLYGLTTRHLFEAGEPAISKTSEKDEKSEDEEDLDEIELDDELSSLVSESSTSQTGLLHEEVTAEHHVSRLFGTQEDLRHYRNMSDAKPGDWALIGLSGTQFVYPNFIPDCQPLFDLQGNLQNPTRHHEVTECAEGLEMGECRQVLVITNHGNLTGSLRHYGSSVVASGQSIGPMDMYDLLLDSGRLLYGDSGSWVVDVHTGKVTGHVVASDVLAEAYVLPMPEILHQIRDFSDAQDVKIATSSETVTHDFANLSSDYRTLRDVANGPSVFDDIEIEAPLSVFVTDHSSFKWQYEDQRRRWDLPAERLDYQSVEPRNDADSTVNILSYLNQRHPPWNPIGRRHHPQSVDASTSADSGSSHASASTLPTVHSFNEDAEADESIIIKTPTNKQRRPKK
ncbi:hypothetical protein LZ31DRAFT_550487 [Colletotrichum somersetense]|nr:hypothetical protein LZ31DRAFT_550487 [Colletotrichum somersetense]